MATQLESKPWAMLEEDPVAQEWALSSTTATDENLPPSAIHPAAHALVAAWLHDRDPSFPLVIVASTAKLQEQLYSDLVTWSRWIRGGKDSPEVGPKVLFFPAWDILPHENKLPHADIISERLQTLGELTHWRDVRSKVHGAIPPLVVASVTALLQKTFLPSELARRTRVIRKGDTWNPLDLIEWLEDQGYEPEAQVTSKGELSWRGGIIDVWPLSSPWPVRLEFFGDEIESLREFDPQSQLSRETINDVTLPPAGELGILKPRITLSGAEMLPTKSPIPLGILVDYLPSNTRILLSQPREIDQHADEYQRQILSEDPFFSSWEEWRSRGRVPGFRVLHLTDENLNPSGLNNDVGESTHVFQIESLDAFRPLAEKLPEASVAEIQRREFFHQLHRWLRSGQIVQVFCNSEGERQRFEEIWLEYGLAEPGSPLPASLPPTVPHEILPGLITRLGVLGRGFLMSSARGVVVTDAEIFGRYKVQRPRRLKSAHAAVSRTAFQVDFSEFEEGDYVVHLQHGIGRYRGLQVLAAKGKNVLPGEGKECLVLEFAPNDPKLESPKLYVPVTEAHLVSKYIGAGKARPALSALGGTRWTKAKDHAQRAVRDLAAELLQLQAARTTQEGHAFVADTAWQREFESAFVYEETADQLRAIDATKQDMESVRPMDRLLCGDVGFGKTEVAIRAAFKAVMGGKQVAILVPTTILAQQHYNSFRERMAEYPMRIELLSRFRTQKEQRAVLEAAATGQVDIVIGTHRLVQTDTAFKDLGLVIVDEEQKFGVKHKETLKRMRATVDLLTLSATPIPRTLYMALSGARDLSTLETPPQDRLPVETIVTNYDERVMRDAILREMNRGGQTYVLHNRVATIEGIALRLRALLPDTRILVGHGQMDPDELEKVMTRFVNGEADVLVSTTIIESGLDIPNANTIIIDRADRFGLSELYQLRGRVGRYKHQAYCYLMLPRHAQLLTEARKRMSAIKQYSALGSGFRIAMRDLEIRGAGNLLGAQQSGHITAVGFDLYCQLLKQSVASLKGEMVKPRVEVRVQLDFLALNPGDEKVLPQSAARKVSQIPDLHVEVPREVYTWDEIDRRVSTEPEQDLRPTMKTPAFIPLDYIREMPQRVEIYRKVAQVNSIGDLTALKMELEDRFGKIPPAVEMLWMVADLRLLAGERQITLVEVIETKVKLVRHGEWIMLGGQFPRMTKKEPRARMNELKKLIRSIEPHR